MSAEKLPALAPEILGYYELGLEAARLEARALERIRTEEILERALPRPPAVVLDVGGGTGVYARALAARGHEVHLVDPVPRHVEEARRAEGGGAIASTAVGDARALERKDASADAVLLFGPLYHLVERADRLTALREAMRVLRPGGVAVAAVISRFASFLDGLRRGILADAEFSKIVERDLASGVHVNATGKPEYFTTAFFHRPEEIRSEMEDAGLVVEDVLAVEGPAWIADRLAADIADLRSREAILAALRKVEKEPAILGASAHILAVGRKRTR